MQFSKIFSELTFCRVISKFVCLLRISIEVTLSKTLPDLGRKKWRNMDSYVMFPIFLRSRTLVVSIRPIAEQLKEKHPNEKYQKSFIFCGNKEKPGPLKVKVWTLPGMCAKN